MRLIGLPARLVRARAGRFESAFDATALPWTARSQLAFLKHHSKNRSHGRMFRTLPTMLTPAIRYIATKGSKTQGGSVQLLCHVKPGVSASREGVQTVSDEVIEVCVAAQAKEGEANKAVREVIAAALKVPKSDVEIAKGMKSRDKTVTVNNITLRNTTQEQEIQRIKTALQESVER